MWQAARVHVRDEALVPPLDFLELQNHTRRMLQRAGLSEQYLRYAAVLLSNEVWRDTLAAIPCDRRLLLLPQCLRDAKHCPAEIDAFGLHCQYCGRCAIGDFLREAEQLGYVCLVAEGSALVMKLIESGQVQAVVGVSCLATLEQVFPYMELGAVPGLAIPLLREGCEYTDVDADMLWDAMYLRRDGSAGRLDLLQLREQVQTWFTPKELRAVMSPGTSPAEELALEYLAADGKRWRPFLVASVYEALSSEPLPPALRPIAVAVECFHKASLIHDDIEDGDPLREGKPTLHARVGLAEALNTGDYLLGEGYRLLADVNCPPETRAAMLRVAAEGHRTLCLGQGEEMRWMAQPRKLSIDEVLHIIRQKTSPAFEVALRLGCLAAGRPDEPLGPIHRYCQSLGMAYQIRDDLHDGPDGNGSDLTCPRPSSVLAMAGEVARGPVVGFLDRLWRREELSPQDLQIFREELARTDLQQRTRDLMDRCKHQAMLALHDLDHAGLKALLRRLIGKIFYDIETMGCCDERTPNRPHDRNA